MKAGLSCVLGFKRVFLPFEAAFAVGGLVLGAVVGRSGPLRLFDEHFLGAGDSG